MRIRSRTQAIISVDASLLRMASFRARALRGVLVVAAVSLLALAIWSARGLDPGTPGLVSGSGGVVVIDLSLSIGEDDYNTIRSTLRRLIDDKARVGLVIFSDVGYELLPPGTPAAELRPLLRQLVPRGANKEDAKLPVNPWSQSFRAGTRISAALELARNMLFRDKVQNASILLLSDLITAPEDVPQLARTLEALRQESVAVRVVPLSPLKDGQAIFEGLLGKSALLTPSKIVGSQPVWAKAHVGLPAEFILLGGLLLTVLAAHERLVGRLALPRTEKGNA